MVLMFLINNAGITFDNLSKILEENWKKVLDINLTSYLFLCKYTIKKCLKKIHGKIINITFNSWTYRFGSSELCCIKSRYINF